jgi:NTE family protein
VTGRVPVSAVYGGGGFFGIAYGLGVVHGLRAEGVELRDVPALGTSAGSWVAAAMVRDVGYDGFDSMDVPGFPDRRSGLLADLATGLFGSEGDPRVSAVVVRARSGQRVVLDGARRPLADLCAASSAVPGIYAAHLIGRSRYVDGGVRSAVSADLAAPADHLVAVVPLGGAAFRGIGRGLDVLLGRELGRWRKANPASGTTVIRPNREIAAAVGTNPRHLFDADRARAVYPMAVEQGRRHAHRVAQPTAHRAAS